MIRSDEDFLGLKKDSNIYIYGAKSIANQVLQVLTNYNYDVKGFVVTQRVGNPESVAGRPVLSIYDAMKRRNNMTIVVAVLPRYKRSIINSLIQLEFPNITMLTDEYVYELKDRCDKPKKDVFFDGTDYCMKERDGIEKNHALIESISGGERGAWRLELKALEEFQRLIDRQLLKNDGLLQEYTSLYGEYNALFSKRGNNEKAENDVIKENCLIYVVRCHLDKMVNQKSNLPYAEEIQAGAVLTNERICALTDDQGINISNKNRDFSECTAIYWIWQNVKKKNYTGIYHYRRQINIESDLLVRQMEQGFDLIHTVPCIVTPNVKQFFLARFLFEADISLMLEGIKMMFPEYYDSANRLLEGHFYLANNIFILKTKWFDKMCEFVFPILFHMEEWYDKILFNREDRYAGYVFEVLYSIFILHHAREMEIRYSLMKFLE